MFPRRGEDQCVIQHSLALGPPIALKTRENSREKSSYQPSLPIRGDGAVCWPALDDRRDLFYGFSRIGMPRTEEPAGRDQFRLGDGGVPGIGGADRELACLRETALEDVHVNGRVVEQGAREFRGAFQEGEVR